MMRRLSTLSKMPVLVAAGLFVTIFTGSSNFQLMAAHGEIKGSEIKAGGNRGASGLLLPRFVSLKAQRVNMRVGPGTKYKVEWMYTKRGLPLEILQEYDNWRKVRDSEGAEGWINQSLLSGKRTALVAPWKSGEKNEYLPLVAKPEEQGRVIAQVEPGVLAEIDECNNGWCRVEIDNTVTGSISGYAKQVQLWGVYPDETLE